jgi:mono/diheme cytochrome c family protein
MHQRHGLWVATALLLWGCREERDLPPPYRRLEVPRERLASAEARQRGRLLFLSQCALCHGEHADGRGLRREGLSSPPRDFTDPTWRRRSSPRRVFYTIREGLKGTPMPAWKTLDDGQIWDLTAYLLSAGEKP